jgi:hypothetical protein
MIVAEPVVPPAINRKLAFFVDPFGNLVELAEVLPQLLHCHGNSARNARSLLRRR